MTPFMGGEQSDRTAEALDRRMKRIRDRSIQCIHTGGCMNSSRKSLPELREAVDKLIGIDGWSWHE
jgi:hypothetical protein